MEHTSLLTVVKRNGASLSSKEADFASNHSRDRAWAEPDKVPGNQDEACYKYSEPRVVLLPGPQSSAFYLLLLQFPAHAADLEAPEP